MLFKSSLYYDHQNGEEDNYNYNNSWFMFENHVIVVCDTHDYVVHLYLLHHDISFVLTSTWMVIYMIVILNFFEFRKIFLISK
jgi:hypothetical protein